MDSTNSLTDDTYTCSLCCDEVFNSKTELIEHLSQLISNILCPICKEHFISLQCLIDHLTHNECDSPENTLKFGIDTQLENSETILPHYDSDLQTTIPSQVNNGDNSDIRKVYEEFQTKGSTKSQEINISQSSNGQYIILAQDDLTDAVVTKNNDGTISLTAIQDMETEADTAINKMESETSQQNDVEVYSCNACGVSFTSVLEHIQTYHKYEEVVVEEPVDENVDTPDPLYAAVQDNQAPRRVITDTGDIVVENDHQSATVSSESYSKGQEPEVVPKKPSPKRYMKVEKLCDSVVKNIKEERKITDYHKVVVKHMKTTKGTVKTYNCIHCNVFVTSLNDLATKQCKKFKYQCPHCDVAYENSKSLCAHMNVHKTKKVVSEIAPDAKVTFDCKTCNTTFPTNKSLKLHMRMHAPVKIRQIEPPLNTERGETNNDKFLCSICDKLIPIDYRAVHHNSHKTDTDNLNCDICNKKFTTPEYLEMHMSVHNLHRITLNNPDKELPYSCLYCHRKFARPHEKVKHERIHTGEKPHSCVICGKSFRVSYCLTLHMRTHTGARPYACPHCPKRFKAHSVYNHHLLTHSEVRAYKCPVCPKAFKTLVQLAGHKNSHTKPFSCQQCNRPFASLYAVRVHTETHNKQNNLKFSCNHCGASYARVSALKDHIKQAHNIHTENNDAIGDATIKDDWNLKAVTEDAPMEEQTIDKAYEATIKDDWNLKAVTEDAPMHEQTIDKAYEIVLELPSNELIV